MSNLPAQVREIVDLSTCALSDWEMVLCVDEKTNLQPRPRKAPTLPARPGSPMRLEHEYKRAGALHLLAAFNTRTGKVYARTERRKRQKEFIALLAQLEREIPSSIRRISLVLDNLSVHKGKQVQTWLQSHPRFVCFFVPVHCSWMNQIEQWFSILQRKRLRISDFSDLAHLSERLMTFVAEWNSLYVIYNLKRSERLLNNFHYVYSELVSDILFQRGRARLYINAHPFNWSTKSVAKVMAKCETQSSHALAI
jgi:transposase